MLRATSLLSTIALAALAAACAQMPMTGGSETPMAPATEKSQSLAPVPARVSQDSYYAQGRETLMANLAKKPVDTPAKNVILFIADGYDPTTVTATRILAGQQKGLSGEENVLAMETLPHLALSKTYNTNMQVPDSAGTATAMMTGVKTKSGVISVSDDVVPGDCQTGLASKVMTTGELAEQAGMAVGIVSTARITHATPATVYAHSADRDWEVDRYMPAEAAGCPDIASQLIDFPYGDGIDVALGGGRSGFLPAEATDPEYEDRKGSRSDGRDLTAEWQERGGTFVWDKAGMDAVSAAPLLGLFEPSHMQYDADRDETAEPSIAEMTQKAIELLSSDEDGYFLMVEGGRVDHAHHAGNAARALTDAIAFDKAVARAMEMVDLSETLIVVTADHGHTMTISGYPERGNPILGTIQTRFGEPVRLSDGKPYTTLSYANGPGTVVGDNGMVERPSVSDEEAQDVDYIQQSLFPTGGETHGGQDVTIFAGGPQAWLFDGTVEQNYIFHVIDYALGLNQRAEAAAAE